MAAERRFSTTLIIGASFLFLIISVLLLWILLNPVDSNERFHEFRNKSESALLLQNYGSCWKSISKLNRFADSSEDWYVVLDLANQLSKKTSKWSYLRKMAAQAVKRHPENEDFWAIYVCAHLWDKKLQKAYDEVDRLYSPEFSNIAAEVFLVKESLSINPDIQPYQGVLTALEENRDPEYYEYIAAYTQNDPLKADAALLWLLEGELERAYLLTKNISDARVPDQISGYIAYDWGDFPLAQSYLLNQMLVDRNSHRERWTLNAILADIAFFSGNYAESEAYYQRSLELEKDRNWKSLLNLSLLSHIQGLDKVSLTRMENALESYPENPFVIVHFIKFWQDEYPVVSKRLLMQYLSSFPDNVSMQLEQMLYFPEKMSPLEYNAVLWELFNKDSGDIDVSRFLVWYLLSMGDYHSAEIVIDRHRFSNPQEQWTGLYEGIIESLESTDSWSEAEKLFNSAMLEDLQPYALFNLAVLQTKQGKGFVALDTLNLAVRQFELQGITQNRFILSRLDSLYGEIYNILGNKEKAEDYARKALEKDDGNSHARALLLEL